MLVKTRPTVALGQRHRLPLLFLTRANALNPWRITGGGGGGGRESKGGSLNSRPRSLILLEFVGQTPAGNDEGPGEVRL